MQLGAHWDAQCHLALQTQTPESKTIPPEPNTKSSYEDEWDVATDALTPIASVMEAIQTAEMEAQQLLTRAAALRQQHCLPTVAAQAQNPKLPSRPATMLEEQ